MLRAFLIAALAVLCVVPDVSAQRRARPTSRAAAKGPVQSACRRSPYVGALAADAKTGKILFADNAAARAYPASVTKLMTMLLVLEDVAAGKYGLDTEVTATKDVYRSEASWIGLKAGDRMSVRDLLYALMVKSANDAAIALAVHSAGSLDGFIAKMNERAAALHMSATRYYNPNGLPPGKRYPWKKFNVSTAADQLKLALALVRHPQALEFTSVKTCDLIRTRGGYRISVTRRVNRPETRTSLSAGEQLVVSWKNHNNVMVKDKLKVHNPDGAEAVDGLKTGYITAGGSSVVLTGKRGGKRAVVVVLGSASAAERDAAARRLMSDALGALSW